MFEDDYTFNYLGDDIQDVKEDLGSIDRTNRENLKNTSSIEDKAKQIAKASWISAAANSKTAFNTDQISKHSAQTSKNTAQISENTAQASENARRATEALNRTNQAILEFSAQQRSQNNVKNEHDFSMWRQTPEGKHYLLWRDNAIRYLSSYAARDEVWQNSWASAYNQAYESISEEDLELHRRVNSTDKKEPDYPGEGKEALWGLAAVISFFVSIHKFNSLFRHHATLFPDMTKNLIGLVIFVIIFIISGRSCAKNSAKVNDAKEDEKAAKNRDSQLETAKSKARVEKFGFDPLRTNPDNPTYYWCPTSGVNDYLGRIRALAFDKTVRPTPDNLIQFIELDVQDPSKERNPLLQQTLIAFKNHPLVAE